MRLIVAAPAGYEPERRYVLGVVLSDRLGLDWELRTEARSDVRLTVGGDPGSCAIVMPDVLFGTAPDAWLQPSSLPAVPLATARSADGWPAVPGGRIAVLFGRTGTEGPVGARTDRGIDIDIDIFGSVFYLLTRYEELAVRERDEYGRAVEAGFTAVRSGTDQVPLADVYVELLWHAIVSLWPGAARREQRYQAVLTHDVDLTFACREPTRRVLHAAAADVLRRRDPSLAVRRLRVRLRGCDDDHSADPWNVFGFMMDVAERNGRTCTFNVLADTAGSGCSDYTLDDPWIRRLLARIHQRGHEIGLHGGFNSHLDPVRIRDEFARLTDTASACGIRQDRWGGRQHFLRWENPVTWRAWESAGLSYDSTLGFARNVGFRAGTCHPYRVYDLVLRRPLRLWERPLIAMDTTWLRRGIGPEDAARIVLEVALTCRRFDGEFVGLWHNNGLASRRHQRWYAELVPQLV